MSVNFYDKVAKKFGGYSFGTNDPEYSKEFENGDPEKDFENKLLKISNNKVALDAGCGDCKFAFRISKNFKKIIGIDTSVELLNVARSKKQILKIKNVSFMLQDANKTGFKNGSFDVVFSRRGPTPLREMFRLLRSGGYFVIIEIGERDAMEIKKVFGRGQNYGDWNKSVQKTVKKEAEKIGFKTVFAKDYFYNEFYKSYEDLDLFLQGVPIFENFDTEKDSKYLKKYVKKFQIDKGIKLPRHRVVFVFQKNPILKQEETSRLSI